MADTFGLEIYASNKLAFAGRAKTLTIPAVDGEQAFLAQHENIVADIRRAQEAKERAEEQMRQKQSIQEYHMNQLALSRAMARLRVTSHKEI